MIYLFNWIIYYIKCGINILLSKFKLNNIKNHESNKAKISLNIQNSGSNNW